MIPKNVTFKGEKGREWHLGMASLGAGGGGRNEEVKRSSEKVEKKRECYKRNERNSVV